MSINMTQHFEFETDDLKSLERMLETILNIMFWDSKRVTDEYSELFITERFPVLYMPNSKVREEKRLFICSVRDYKSDIREDDDMRFGSKIGEETFTKVRQEVLNRIGLFNEEEFKQYRGDGFNAGFNRFDGSIGLGYRLEHSPSGGWDNLDVYLVHAYYGK